MLLLLLNRLNSYHGRFWHPHSSDASLVIFLQYTSLAAWPHCAILCRDFGACAMQPFGWTVDSQFSHSITPSISKTYSILFKSPRSSTRPQISTRISPIHLGTALLQKAPRDLPRSRPSSCNPFCSRTPSYHALMLHHVGMNFLESSSCWLADSGNAAIPAIIPKIMRTSDIIDQSTPQHCEEPPYFFAKTLASELLTLRRMRSSHWDVVLA